MLRLICGCTVTERKVTAKVGELLELEPVSLVVKNGRLDGLDMSNVRMMPVYR